MIKWVFFDLDNVVFNDEPCFALVLQRLHELLKNKGKKVSFEEILSQREALIEEGETGKIHQIVAKKYLKQSEFDVFFKGCLDEMMQNFLQYNPVMPGVDYQIHDLEKRYSLGIAANHVRRSIEALENIGLLNSFKIVAVSEDMRVSKPSARFFALTLSQKNVDPSNAIMIGDRVELDIVPASKIGMKTVWLDLKDDQKYFSPRNEYEEKYLESMKRTPTVKHKIEWEGVQPDITIKSISQIAYAVGKLAQTFAGTK